ncbi:MAG: HAD-IB family hydrolase [Victivallaceae bacterium]|nr:HAD-IB family hydrolase [Victivallaceae bacterium]
MGDTHFFDMDGTLISSDCDVTWKEFLIAENLAGDDTDRLCQFFFEQYKAGCLDHAAFELFQLREFQGRTPEAMAKLADRHFADFVRKNIYPEAEALVADLLRRGDRIYILTSTNEVIAAPLARHLHVTGLFGSRLALESGRYTGRFNGPCLIGEAKAHLAEQFCAAEKISPSKLFVYGDSINDLPLMLFAGRPEAFNPSEALLAEAQKHAWPVKYFAPVGANQ